MMREFYGTGLKDKYQDEDMTMPPAEPAVAIERPFVDYAMDEGDQIQPMEVLLGRAMVEEPKTETDADTETETNDDKSSSESSSEQSSDSDDSDSDESDSGNILNI